MKITKTLLHRMSRLNQRRGLFGKGDRVLIALSGGPDSIALAHLLSLWQKKLHLRFFAAHLHHGLSAQNDSALKLAQRTARDLKIPFYSKRVRVGVLAKKKKMTLEEAGRYARYAYFDALAKRLGANRIATAHTQDDQAETVLMRLIRGCGQKGLAGIPAKRPLGVSLVIRPLLDCPKRELLEFLQGMGLRYQKDRSNQSRRFTRNRVRHSLIPWIEKNMNPSVRETLARLADRMSD